MKMIRCFFETKMIRCYHSTNNTQTEFSLNSIQYLDYCGDDQFLIIDDSDHQYSLFVLKEDVLALPIDIQLKLLDKTSVWDFHIIKNYFFFNLHIVRQFYADIVIVSFKHVKNGIYIKPFTFALDISSEKISFHTWYKSKQLDKEIPLTQIKSSEDLNQKIKSYIIESPHFPKKSRLRKAEIIRQQSKIKNREYFRFIFDKILTRPKI